MAADPTPDNTEHPSASDERVEALLFECLESKDPSRAIADAASANPDLAEQLQRAYREMERFDLVGQPPSSGSGGFGLKSDSVPEKLGEYRLKERLGAGGMGVVFLAQDEVLQRTVALKLIRPEHLYMSGARERFQREVETIARLQHPGIVPIYGVGKSDGMPYFTMQHVRGCSVSAALSELQDHKALPDGRALLHIAANKAQSVPESESDSHSGSTQGIDALNWSDTCVTLAAQIAGALHHAHERGVLHRDVKPSNILLTTEGRAMLVDFGLAWSDDAEQRLTASASQLGSLPYLPPEHIDGKAPDPSRAADVYSLGVTLYEMLTLRNPFLGKNGEETRRNILGARRLRLRDEQRGVSWELETVCMKALDPDPTKRYRTMLEFQRDLERVRNRESISARRPGMLRRSRRWAQRHPTSVAALSVALLGSIAALAMFSINERQARIESDGLRQTAETERYSALVSNADVELNASSRPERARHLLSQCREEDRAWEWAHLEYASDQSITSSIDAGAAIQDLKWCPDNESYIVATQNSELIKLTTDGRELWRQSNIETSAFTFLEVADGHQLIGARRNGTIWVHDLASGKPLHQYQQPDNAVTGELTAIVRSPDGKRLYTTCSTGHVSAWDAEERRFLQHMGKHRMQGHRLGINHDGTRIASGGFDRTVRLFDTDKLEQVREWPTHHWPLGVSFTVDGSKLAISDGLMLRGIDLNKEGNTSDALDPSAKTVLAVACSPDGKLIAAAVQRRILHIYRITSEQPLRIERLARLLGHGGLLQHISFTKDSKRILTGSTDQTVRVWSPQNCAQVASRAHNRLVTQVAFVAEETMVSGDSRGNLRLTSPDGTVSELKVNEAEPAHAEAIVAILPHDLFQFGDRQSGIFSSIDKDGRMITWGLNNDGCEGGPVTETGLKVAAATTLTMPPSVGMSWTPNIVTPVIATTDGKIHVLGDEPRSWQAHDSHITALVCHHQKLWSTCIDGHLKCWDATTGELLREGPQHPQWISSLVVAPDGSWVATGCADTLIRTFDAKTAELLHELEGHARAPLAMVTDETGDRLISSGGFDAELRFWHPASGRCMLSMGRMRTTMAMAFDNQTSTLGLGSQTGYLYRLRTRSGGPREFVKREAVVDTITSPPGKRRGSRPR